jgi:geranylgeranyl diphosphate synthase type II
MELAWRRDPGRHPTLDDYLRLVLYKSCWYTTIYPLRAGCIVGSRGAVALGAITRFGFLLGAAFQVRDDLLDVAGDPGVHGKERLADLREGKQTLLLIHVRSIATEEERRWIDSFLAMPALERAPADAVTLYELMRTHGSIQAAEAWADGLVVGARAAFEPAFERAVSRFHVDFIEGIIDFVVRRAL